MPTLSWPLLSGNERLHWDLDKKGSEAEKEEEEQEEATGCLEEQQNCISSAGQTSLSFNYSFN